MLFKLLRWLGRNLSTLLLAFIMALVVWVSAVLSADPNLERQLAHPVPIDFRGKDPNLKIMGDYPTEVNMTLNAPKSVWDQLDKDEQSVQAWVDLSSLKAGEFDVKVQVQISIGPVRLVQKDPDTIHLVLETVVTQTFPVSLVVNGEPPLGYSADTPVVSPPNVVLSGPVSIISRVSEVRTEIDIAGVNQTITRTVALTPMDINGRLVTGVNVTPSIATVTQPIHLLGGYRDVIVKVVTTGIVASGYRLSNYFVNPSSVIVFSSDPQKVESLPGYVETKPLDLTNASDDFEALLELDLPDGVSAVTDSRVLVQVSIAAIESSLTVSLPVDITGLTPGLQAVVAPSTVDVILSGPVPVLNSMKPSDIRVKVDLTGYGVGIIQIIPVIDFLPQRVQKQSISPGTVEVSITAAPTPTPTLTPSPTPTPTPTPRPR